MEEIGKFWYKQINILSTIAETQPPAAYSTVVSAFKNKLSYFLITIPNIRATNWYLQNEE